MPWQGPPLRALAGAQFFQLSGRPQLPHDSLEKEAQGLRGYQGAACPLPGARGAIPGLGEVEVRADARGWRKVQVGGLTGWGPQRPAQ